MKVQECIDNAFRLLNQYSIQGTVTPESYNSQGDDIARMVALINDAQMEIAKTVKPIVESYTFTVNANNHKTGWAEVVAPSDFDALDCIRFISGEPDSMSSNADIVGVSKYRMLGNNTIFLPTDKVGTYVIEYKRYPIHLNPVMNAVTRAATNLDNTPDTHEAIPYYIASIISLDQNTYAYAAFNNAWEVRLQRLNNKQAHTESRDIEDVYGFGRGLW